MPRKQGMERKDLLAANVKIFKAQGQALDKFGKKSVKVLVVGNPANTNAIIMQFYAPSIPKENFSAMTRYYLRIYKPMNLYRTLRVLRRTVFFADALGHFCVFGHLELDSCDLGQFGLQAEIPGIYAKIWLIPLSKRTRKIRLI